MKHKINKKLIFKESGFTMHNRYSRTGNTDKIGRWARIIYYNGIQIAWIRGFVAQKQMPILDDKRVGTCNSFHVCIYVPTSSSGIVGYNNFDTIDEAYKYVKDIFTDFLKIMNK